MQHHVSLLRRSRPQVRQPFPLNQVLCARNPALRHRRRGIPLWRLRIFSLRAEQPVNPSILVPHHANVVHVCVRLIRRGHHHRIIPKPEVGHSIRTFRHRKEWFPIHSFNAHKHQTLPFVFHRARIERCVHANSFHQVRVVMVIGIVAPEQRRVLRRQYWICLPVIHPVAGLGFRVLARDQLLVSRNSSCTFFLNSACFIQFLRYRTYNSLSSRAERGICFS